MLKSTIQVTLFSIFGIVINFVIQLILAYFFGASQERDAYYAALTIPAYVALLFTGSIGILLIPYIIKHTIDNPDDKKNDIISPAINFTTLLLLLISIPAVIFAEPVMNTIIPSDKPELLQTSGYLFRILMFSMIFTVLNNLLSSAFQSRHSFFIPSVSTIITNVSSLVSVALLSPYIGISSIAYGTLAGGLFAFIFLFMNLRQKFQYQWRNGVLSPELKILLKASLPLFSAGLIFRSTTVFERYFASRLPEGSLSYLGNGNQIVMILSTIVSTGIVTTSFPLLSKYWSENNKDELEKTFLKVLNIILLIVFPLITIFIVSGKDLINILFRRGAFSEADTLGLYYTLLGLMGFLLFSSMGNVVARILYLSGHTKAMSIIAVFELVIYIASAAVLGRYYGYIGLAACLSLASAFNVTVSLIYIYKKILVIRLGELFRRIATISVISLIILLPLFLLNSYLFAELGSFLRAGMTILLIVLLFQAIMTIVLKDKYYISLIQLIRNKIKANG